MMMKSFFLLSLVLLSLVIALSYASEDACTTWYETTQHGKAFRNVQSYGAKGDGNADDTAAIITALTQGRQNIYSTEQVAVVYFPPGTYKVSQSLPMWGYTHIIGNYLCRPKIVLADNAFPNGGYLISATFGNSENTENFYHQIHNIDLDLGAGNRGSIGIHWAVAQGTSLRNISINVNSGDRGIFIENGGGGGIFDLEIIGGNVGIMIGGQQWALRSITVRNAKQTGIDVIWNWAFSFLDINVFNTPIGIDFSDSAVTTLSLLDSTFTSCSTAINTDTTGRAGLLLDKVTVIDTPKVTSSLNGNATGTVYVNSWRQGPAYSTGERIYSSSGNLPVVRDIVLPLRPRDTFGPNVYNVYDAGAKGDGVTDDTIAIQKAVSGNAQVFFPYGTYVISSTVTLKSNTTLIGEGFSVLTAKANSPAFSDPNNPQPLILVPPGGSAEFADLVFSSDSNLYGAILLKWQGSVSIWDVHARIYNGVWGIFYGTGNAAAYIENSWLWVADHNINTGEGINVTSHRGLLLESSGPSYLYSSASEHSTLFEYNFTSASNIYTLLTQTEIPYWIEPVQSIPLIINNSQNVFSYGSGEYTWFHGSNVTTGPTLITSSKNTYIYGSAVHNYLDNIIGDHSILANYTDTFCSFFIADVPY